jgi:SAM-dependent methyltransferase
MIRNRVVSLTLLLHAVLVVLGTAIAPPAVAAKAACQSATPVRPAFVPAPLPAGAQSATSSGPLDTVLQQVQQAYIKASNPEIADRFGFTVSLSGDTAVVGAIQESSNATGVNGNQGNNDASVAGAVYVFVRNGTSWSQQAYLKASNTQAFDKFGYDVAVSGDTIVVGAPFEASNATGVNGDQSNNDVMNAGAAYVFVRSVTGVDIWSRRDQSGNARDVTLRNASLEGVADRVAIETGDMRALPFRDASFDLVVSSLAIHNIRSNAERRKAVAEAFRVLKPGGTLVIADIRATRLYADALRSLGASNPERRRLGWRFWWGNPLAATTLLTASRATA